MSVRRTLRSGLLLLAAVAAPALAFGQAPPPVASGLDFATYRERVEPLFTTERPGLMACVTCHAGRVGTRLRLEPLAEGATRWTEDQSRKNFAAAASLVVPGKPLGSRLLLHPLAREAGGDGFHGGGKHWQTQGEPEWQALADWVRGAAAPATAARAGGLAVRIVQTNAAGHGAHLIDPATNRVVGEITGVEIPHGVTASLDGRYLYLSNEHLSALDVVDATTLKVSTRIPLSGRPNNVALSKDGKKVYIGIRQAPGALDVIDTATLKNVKSVPVKGEIHNVYVTPDGRFAVAGSIAQKTISIVDTATDTLVRSIELSAGIRPMAFDTNPDGSTRRIYVQLSDFHGFVAVDFATGKEVARVTHPPIEGEHPHTDGLQGAPAHGLAVSPDGKTLWSTSKVYGYAYVHALPDLKEVGRVFVGQHPEWITFTPDGKFLYVAAAGDNQVFVVDTASLTVVARVPVGQVPKRNATALLVPSR